MAKVNNPPTVFIIALVSIVVIVGGVQLFLHTTGTAAAVTNLADGLRCSYDQQCAGGLCAKVLLSDSHKKCARLNSFSLNANCTSDTQCQSEHCLYPFDSYFQSQKASPICAMAESVLEGVRCVDNPQCWLGLTCRRSSTDV